MTKKIEGGCLCGAVRYRGDAEPMVMGHCQCIDCRKASGTGHGSHMMVSPDAMTITGTVKIYESPADSGNIVGRAFCPECGCAVYSVNSGMPGMLALRASSLDDPELFEPQMVVYNSRGPSWDTLDPALPKFETMPPSPPSAG